MVVYNVFSSCVYYHYKAYICSKATLVLIIISVLTVLFPLLFTYKSHGFWLRTDIYQEQPKVNFLYDYVIFFDVAKLPGKKFNEDVYLCSSIENVLYMTRNYNYCPYIAAYEEDLNEDGFNDILKFETKIFLPPGTEVKGISLMLLFDYKLSGNVRAQFEAAAYIEHTSPLPGAGIDVVGDLGLVQRQPLNPRRLDTRYNKTVVPRDTTPVVMGDILREYALRNLSTRLTNVYTTWTKKRLDAEPFTVTMTVIYSEASVKYKPTTWQQLRFAWAQFFPVLFVSIYIFKSVKDFIFSNQLVNTYKEEPWSKGH